VTEAKIEKANGEPLFRLVGICKALDLNLSSARQQLDKYNEK
jgi:hypothetical protein